MYSHSKIEREKVKHNPEKDARKSLENLAEINLLQLEIYNNLLEKIKNSQEGLIYVDGNGGCGKTFLLNAIHSR